MANGKERDGGHERRSVYAQCCTYAYSRYEYHPDACINCKSPCEYGRKALELNGISMETKRERDSESEPDWLTQDRMMRKIVRALNRRRV